MLCKTEALRVGDFSSVCHGVDGLVLELCLYLRRQGWRLVADGGYAVNLAHVYAPAATDRAALRARYKTLIQAGDPYYNVHLCREPADFRPQIDAD
jgi:hypothetical protein